jgi:hypothetical protein
MKFILKTHRGHYVLFLCCNHFYSWW